MDPTYTPVIFMGAVLRDLVRQRQTVSRTREASAHTPAHTTTQSCHAPTSAQKFASASTGLGRAARLIKQTAALDSDSDSDMHSLVVFLAAHGKRENSTTRLQEKSYKTRLRGRLHKSMEANAFPLANKAGAVGLHWVGIRQLAWSLKSA